MACEYFLSIFSCLVFFSSLVASTEWTAASMPNPYTNVSECGNSEPGFVCNPDSILTAEQVKHLNEVIRRDIITTTNCVCIKDCPNVPFGYLMAIAVVNDVYIEGEKNFIPKEIETRLTNMTNDIRYKWNLGLCENDGAILVVTSRKRIYTVAGNKTSYQFGKDCITAINEKYSGIFQAGDIIGGLDQTLENYGYTLKNFVCAVDFDGTMHYVDKYRTGEVVAVVIGAVFCACVVLACVGTLVYCDHKSSGMDPGDIEKMANEVALKQEALRRYSLRHPDRDELLQGERASTLEHSAAMGADMPVRKHSRASRTDEAQHDMMPMRKHSKTRAEPPELDLMPLVNLDNDDTFDTENGDTASKPRRMSRGKGGYEPIRAKFVARMDSDGDL